MAKAEPKDSLCQGNQDQDPAPPPSPNSKLIASQQGINNSVTNDTIISLPEVIVNDGDGTQALENNFAFNDKQIRRGFIRKVYSIILVQLSITVAIIMWFKYDYNLEMFVKTNILLFCLATVSVYVVTLLIIFCCAGPRRRVPYNYILLFLFTLSLSAFVGVITIGFNFQEIVIAGGITLAIVLSLTIFAFQTKIDFTLLSGSLLCILLVFSLFGIAMIYSPFSTKRLLYTAIGVFIMCIYLVFDTQLMMSGKHRYTLSPEEYVFAALNLYLDIIHIFIKILVVSR